MKKDRLSQRYTWLLTLIACMFTANVGLAIDRAELDAKVDEAVAKYKTEHPEAADMLSKAPGVLGCPVVRTAGFVFGMERGACVLRIGGKTDSYYRVTGAKWGLLAGAQSRGMLLVFRTPEALKKFNDRSKEWEVGADFGVAIAQQSADGTLNLNTIKGDTVALIFAEKGLMADVSLEGTRFKQIPKIEDGLVEILAKGKEGQIAVLITRWSNPKELHDLASEYKAKGAGSGVAKLNTYESCGKVFSPNAAEGVTIRYAYARKVGDNKWKTTLVTTDPLGKAAEWAAAQGAKNNVGLFNFILDANQQGTGQLELGLEPGFDDDNNVTLKSKIPAIQFDTVTAADF